MRRSLSFLALVLVLGVAGCGDPDAGKLFADVQYATRCPTTNHCPGPADRDVCGINQGMPCMGVEGTAVVSCDVTETADGSNYLLNFSVSQSSGFSLSVRNAQVATTGGFAGGANCSVRVQEGPNVYEGDCGASAPNPEQPCQLSSILFTDDMGNPTLEGQILCRDMPNQSTDTLQIDVTQAGIGGADMPGRFRIANCQGLTVE